MFDHINKDTTVTELENVLRTNPVRPGETGEKLIARAREIANEKSDESWYPRMLLHVAGEYLVTDSFDVGIVTATRFGLYSGTGKDSGKYVLTLKDDPEHFVGDRDYVYATEEEVRELAKKYSEIYTQKSEDVEVEFTTSKLVIGNFFYPMDELPKNVKWDEEFSINGALGRVNTMKWLAENRGIAYGQLDNTTAAVYQVSADKILVTSNYLDDLKECYDEDNLILEKIKLPEAKYIGNFDCSVWRFEAVEKTRLEAWKENEFAQWVKDNKDEDDDVEFRVGYDDPVEVTINPGKWALKVYYQHNSDEEMIEKFGFPLYAELTRIIEA